MSHESELQCQCSRREHIPTPKPQFFYHVLLSPRSLTHLQPLCSYTSLVVALTLHILPPAKRHQSSHQQYRIHHHAKPTRTVAFVVAATWSGSYFICGGCLGGWVAFDALQGADGEALEDLPCFVAVADVFEGFGGVLAADVEEDFFAASEEEGQ